MLFGLCIVLACCGGQTGPGSGNGPLPTAKLTASPSTLVAGQNITLTWSSTNADSGTIDQGVGTVGLNGSTVLIPGTVGYPTAANTTFTYTVTGPGGTATSTAIVTVNLMSSFDGLRQSDGAVGDDVDPNGAVGLTQYLEYVNTAVQAYDKATGNALWTQPKPIYTLWPPQSPCRLEPSGTPAIQLDVHIIYDRLASRWVVGAKTSDPNQGYYFCLAVSSEDNLTTATWSGYNSTRLDSMLGTNPIDHKVNATDWPKIATWSDASGAQSAYYETADLESVNSDGSIGAEVSAFVCAFDRPDILNNPANIKPELCVNLATVGPTTLTSDGIYLAHSLIPADIDGTTPAPAGRDEFMVSIQNPDKPLTGGPLTSDTINLWDFHVDWTVPSLTATWSSLPVQSYTPGCYLASPGFPSVTNCVTEPAPAGAMYGQHIDSVGDRFMPRFAYRNFMSTQGHESFLVSHTVEVTGGQNTKQTGIRWYELTGDGTSAPTVSQQGTIDPDPFLFRFLPSIAEDKVGNAAVGYSYSNSNTPPGINMSYWNLPSATTPTEITILNAASFELNDPPAYTGAWGTYSSMTVDPKDDCTFWYVNEYFVAGNLWRTSIDNFKLPNCK